MLDKKLNFILATLAGTALAAATILVLHIPAQIQKGNQGQIAIQMLDTMRPPMLAIKIAENTVTNADAADLIQSNREILLHRLARYRKAARYNEELLKRVGEFAALIEGWLLTEQRYWQASFSNHDGATQTNSALRKATLQKFLHAMDVLALGETPIHRDITAGRAAAARLEGIAAVLILYLLSLIIIYQYRGRRTLLATLHDLQQAKRDVANREEYLAQTLNSIGDAVIATGTRGQVTRMNPVAEQLTGWTSDAAIGKPLKDVFHIINAMTRKAAPDPVEIVLQSGKIVGLANHTVLLAQDGHEYQIADSGAPIRDDRGRILGVILVFRDVTEEYRLQEELRQHRSELEQRVAERTCELERMNEELEAFSYAVSHDLRAPLRAINGFSEALEEDCHEQLGDSGKTYLARIRAATLRMGQLIDDLLHLSHINRHEITYSKVDVSGLARDICQLLREQHPGTTVTIADDLWVHSDVRLLRIILENLIGNAWKYSAGMDNPHIVIRSEDSDKGKVFCVRDNGIGFDMEYADRLFQVFQRLHGREFEGTGIGLATVKRIISRLGGEVWADSAPNEGAAFFFSLPEPGEEEVPSIQS